MSTETSPHRTELRLTRRQVDLARARVAASRALGEEPDPFMVEVANADTVMTVEDAPSQRPRPAVPEDRTTRNGRYVARSSSGGKLVQRARGVENPRG